MKNKKLTLLEKYKRISILSLFCLVFGILCLSICVVGFSFAFTDNIALASDYNPNLLGGTIYSPSNFSTSNSTYDGYPYPFNKYLSNGNATYIGSFSVDIPNNNFCTIVRTGTTFMNGIWGCDVSGVLEPNTTYTLSINVKALNGSNTYSLFVYNTFNNLQINTYPLSQSFSNLGVNSFTFNTGSNIQYNYVGFTFGSQLGDITWDRFKLEIGDHFTGWEYTEYMRGFDDGYEDGYQDGYNVGSAVALNNPFVNGILWDYIYFDELPFGNDGSFFEYNGLNYRFNFSVVGSNNNFIETNVQLSWPLTSNGDTNHRYVGFRSPDTFVFPSNPILNFTTNNPERAYFVCFYNNLAQPTIIYLNDYDYYDTSVVNVGGVDITLYSYAIYLPNNTNYFYYLSTLTDVPNTAGDFISFNRIGVYYIGETLTAQDYNAIYQKGYNEGYDDAVDLNEMNFYSLFGAIYDVPIKAFNGLFDITILGVNLKGFILGLISLCIVLFILKIVFK